MKGKVFIYRGKPPIISRIIASIFYASFLTVIFLYIKNVIYSNPLGYFGNIYTTLMVALPLFVGGFSFSLTSSHEFDFDNKKYREYINIGAFGYGYWEDFNELNRVSTFVNSKGYCEVNIIDIKNKKYNTLAFKNIDDAVVYGRDLAKNLEIKFLERN
ncbi:hypothetical protein [Polaribacter sp. Z022]|uniref:hypothetical protein n=1 Tax=Polaribacter sp. Z022 TaxID=2927125 RepID=UPI002022071A|nr:hypothetical protein [Polaribacter sp. Z022]MCL7752174.1 hypothetical protein [Polaribacter sp. Z022]